MPLGCLCALTGTNVHGCCFFDPSIVFIQICVAGNEFCERLAYNGLSNNLIVYFTVVVGMSKSDAASQVTLWGGACSVTALLGAWVADEFLGRFKTILYFSIVYLVGFILLTLSSFLQSGNSDSVNTIPLFVALYLVALGTGGIKSNVSSFGADQFDESIEEERKAKESFFNWFYMVINLGSLFSSSVIIYIQTDVSWTIGYLIPTIFMGMSIVIFVLGSGFYKMNVPIHSPLSRCVNVVFEATRNSFKKKPSGATMTPRMNPSHGEKSSWLDKAVKPIGKFNHDQVDEVKLVVGLLPIMIVAILYWTVYSQMGTTFVLQGMQMDQMIFGMQVPPATLITVNIITVIVLVPLFDRVIWPGLERIGCKITLLQKIGWGMVIVILAVLYAGVLETYRLHLAHTGHIISESDSGDPPKVALSIFWQAPAYIIIGVSEIFASIGQIEFFYNQAPDSMRSCCTALQLLATALGSFLSSGLIALVEYCTEGNPWMPYNLNIGHLNYLFFLVALIGATNLLFYIYVAGRYRVKSVDHAAPSSQTTAYQSLETNDDEIPSKPSISIRKHGGRDLFPARSLTETLMSPALPSNMR